jgi:ABC-2 type transport system ATP-binding protein
VAVASEIEGVTDVTVRRSQLRVTCTEPRAKAAVVARLVDRGFEIVDVGAEEASLEDVFAAYTTDDVLVPGDDERSSGERGGGERRDDERDNDERGGDDPEREVPT